MNRVEGSYVDGRVGVETLIRTIAEKGLRQGTQVRASETRDRGKETC